MAATLDRGPDGGIVRKAGVMAIVVAGGEIRPGDPIVVELADRPPWRFSFMHRRYRFLKAP